VRWRSIGWWRWGSCASEQVRPHSECELLSNVKKWDGDLDRATPVLVARFLSGARPTRALLSSLGSRSREYQRQREG
jgi:hypothetical protein